MAPSAAEAIKLPVDGALPVSALLRRPSHAQACFILAPGAGAGIAHPFITSVATELAARDVATLCYQFPYMERGSKRPDSPALCHATVRAAVGKAAAVMPKTPLIAGGKSFGGRMTSQAQSVAPLPGVCGLAFLGFPLHPAKLPSDTRAKHLSAVRVPMLFLQGTRDELADLALLEPVIVQLGDRATLRRFENADHSFHAPKRSGRDDTAIRDELVQALGDWIQNVIRDR